MMLNWLHLIIHNTLSFYPHNISVRQTSLVVISLFYKLEKEDTHNSSKGKS